jgi:hypothetical protein
LPQPDSLTSNSSASTARRVSGVRWAALASLAAMMLFFLPELLFRWEIAAILLPGFLLPFALLFWLLQRDPVTTGLAAAMGVGVSGLLVVTGYTLLLIAARGQLAALPFGLAWGLSQAVLFWTARGAHRIVSRPATKGRTFRAWLLVPALYLAVVLFPMTLSTRILGIHPHDYSEQYAVSELRTIFNAVFMYQVTYGNGYPSSLEVLGPAPDREDCNSAGLIEGSLLSRQRRNYQFTYLPGPEIEKAPEDCRPGVQSFKLVARPVEYGGVTARSFIIDDSGAIHATLEDRSATLDDPPVD